MPENLKPEANGGLSNPSSPTVDEAEVAMRRLKIDMSFEPGQGFYPERKGEPDCIYFLRTGSCSYGSNCRFNHPSHGGGLVNGVYHTSEHPERVGQPKCEFYMKTGTCKYGSTCKYHHPKNRQADSLALLNVVGLPMRQDSESCRFYMRTGQCKYGYLCKYHHPQPATNANSTLPVYGSQPSGSSRTMPSPITPSIGELSAASLSNAPYGYNSLQVPQNYMPFYLPPPQNWSTFMGNPNPSSVTSYITTPASNGQISIPNYLPERPNKPECRNFMNNGSCKYGSECRYHHPSSIGPNGLPLRPGQPLCSYYSIYGVCESGPNCNFHHPILDGYSYGYVPTPVATTSYSYQIIPSTIWITNASSSDHSISTLPRSSKASIEPLHEESD